MLVSNIQLSYLKNGVWSTFTNQAQTAMDGIKIQTPANSSYYLKYRTWNSGKSDWYSRVDSNVDDYAGASGRPIQRLQIQVYQNDGTKLTTKIVVMYRARVAGRWLPWVSNAEPEWMQSVHTKYNLGGTISTDSYYAGNAGENIDGLEIRVYEEGILGDFTGGEVGATMQYMVDSLDNWQSFENRVLDEHIDGIKLQTSAAKGYYLQYRTWNEGKTDYYPYVKSTGTAANDYAGYPGKPIQRLQIQVCKNDGTLLRSGVIVMYRVTVAGRWLPWVSNADPEWMRDIQNKHGLSGSLSVNSTYAGNPGENIDGVEIRIFEDDSENAGVDSFTGFEEIVSAAYMCDSLTNWNPFEKSVTAAKIDGISLSTDADEPYYLMYKSWNAGNNSFYPEVNSLYSGDNNYAGYPGKPIQLLSIQAYSQDGTRLRSGVVVMYRVRVSGRWLPWVSNADPEWMQSVQKQFGLDGTLDTKSTYAGNKGENIDGVEIRVFQGQTDRQPVGSLPGTESTATLQYMTDSLSNWKSFTDTALNSHIDGIKIQTDASKPYYLTYRSWNEGKAEYYPYVNSTGTAYNDYAGYPGKPIQLLNIYVYRKSDGVKLKSGVVVMYRVRVAGRWLPWVSNANPEWMRSVQEKYDLGGTLDTRSTYAGNKGQNIDGVEIHIYEENDTNGGTIIPTGIYKIIQDVPFISQMPKYPTGCESVSTVMALQHAGVKMTVENFIDNYLDKGSNKSFDPNVNFGGNPYSTSGYGCYSPVIMKALNKILANSLLYAKEEKGKSIEYLCTEYINRDIPVIFWATQHMAPPRKGTRIPYNGGYIQWISPMHCLLLVGYDDTHYIFHDPQEHALTYYSKESVEAAYAGLFKQAVVIKNYKKPDIPSVPSDAGVMSDIITHVRQLEDVYQNYFRYVVFPSRGGIISPSKVLDGVLDYLRAPQYNGLEWFATAGKTPDQAFINFVESDNNGKLNEYFTPYILKGNRKMVTDGNGGIIDLSHMAATMSAYFGGAVPDFWASWGGDLASGMEDTTNRIYNRDTDPTDKGKTYLGMTDQEIADVTIGGDSRCNYSDFCSDFDAYKLQQRTHELLNQAENIHPLSDAMQWYYSNGLHKRRFQWILEELNCTLSIYNLNQAIFNAMTGADERVPKYGLLASKGGDPSDEVIAACCKSLARYIYSMNN